LIGAGGFDSAKWESFHAARFFVDERELHNIPYQRFEMAIGLVAGCEKPLLTHNLVVIGNQQSEPLYSDEQT